MRSNVMWENRSVLNFADNADPIKKMEETAQEIVLDAVDNGWQGPPFDPLELASLRGIKVRPNASVPDARISEEGSTATIEYNPNKSLGRINFSIAHEIAHTFFDDWADKTRNRQKRSTDEKNWQLEMLCNIGAAEILMPVGSMSEKFEKPLPIEEIMQLRRDFKVSTEAMLIRMAKLAKFPVISFAASKIKTDQGVNYRIDYVIPSSSWRYGAMDQIDLNDPKCFEQCVAIGTTARAIESWLQTAPDLKVEAVGLPPYPGTNELRIAGFAYPFSEDETLSSDLEYRHGDATVLPSSEKTAIVHIVNNKAKNWGGFGFSRALRSKYPEANTNYRNWAMHYTDDVKLGNMHMCHIEENGYIASLIAQSGYGQSTKPRIRYAALHNSFDRLSEHLLKDQIANVQMPRIGAGQAGGNWNIIEGIIYETLVLNGINVKVYDLPPN